MNENPKCPECGGESKQLRKRRRYVKAGKRYQCESCSHRWFAPPTLGISVHDSVDAADRFGG